MVLEVVSAVMHHARYGNRGAYVTSVVYTRVEVDVMGVDVVVS